MTCNPDPSNIPSSATVVIDHLRADGRAVADLSGRAVVIDRALPGEVVEISVRRPRRGDLAGTVLQIHKASPERSDPFCPSFDLCGGCSLQHLSWDEQIRHKEQLLRDHLINSSAPLPAEWLPPLRSESRGYRRKARLSVKHVAKKDRVLVGFHERQGRYVADLNSCEVLDPRLSRLISELSEFLSVRACGAAIPQIEVARGDDGTALVVRHLAPLSDEDLAGWGSFAEARSLQLYLQPGGLGTVHRITPHYGPERLHYTIPRFGITFEFHPLDFIQVNGPLNAKMVERVVELMDPAPGESILDLFCGLGNFTLPMATRGATLTGVEGEDTMVARAQENARMNGITNARFYRADLRLPFRTTEWGANDFDKVLLDPPRSGAGEIIPEIVATRAKRIVYVSCNPETLARDAARLVVHGYRLAQAGIIDMFPHTLHVESVAVFERA
jgi:23S rRNA (uracil1939-C5)-methyltransferase